jgi:hypothetical protein
MPSETAPMQVLYYEPTGKRCSMKTKKKVLEDGTGKQAAK